MDTSRREWGRAREGYGRSEDAHRGHEGGVDGRVATPTVPETDLGHIDVGRPV